VGSGVGVQAFDSATSSVPDGRAHPDHRGRLTQRHELGSRLHVVTDEAGVDQPTTRAWASRRYASTSAGRSAATRLTTDLGSIGANGFVTASTTPSSKAPARVADKVGVEMTTTLRAAGGRDRRPPRGTPGPHARPVEVAESLADVRGRLVFGQPKTYQRRTIPIPKSLTDELTPLVGGKRRNDLVFTASDGGPLRHGNFYRRYSSPR
jgi:hypothetical protein